MLAALDAIVVGVVLAIFGVPLAGSLAVIAFIAGFVPVSRGGRRRGDRGVRGARARRAAAGDRGARGAARVRGSSRPGSSPAPRWAAGPTSTRCSCWSRSRRASRCSASSGCSRCCRSTVFVLAVWRSVIAALDLAPPERGPMPDAEPAVAPPDLPEGVPLWLERVAQWSWRALVLAALAGLVISLVVRIPQVDRARRVIAVVFAATLLPLVDRAGAAGLGPRARVGGVDGRRHRVRRGRRSGRRSR